MKTFKAFDKNLKCRGYQFEVGKTYTHAGEVKICASGFHSCENPLDVMNYYDITESRFCIVEVNGTIERHNDDSKISSSEITIRKELRLADYIDSCIKYLLSICRLNNNSQLAASGNSSQLAASGDHSQLAASGDCSIACNAGVNGRVKSGKNGAMSLCYFNNKEKRYRIVVAYVGEDGIKQDTWYMLNEKHKFTECE